jgi:hypothetical protein
VAGDEGPHPAGDDPLWAESWSFEFFDEAGSVGGHVRLGLHPAAATAWYWAYLVGPGRPVVAVRDHDVPLPRSRGLEVRAEGLWSMLTCETPDEHWSIGLEAFAVALDDPAEAYAGERGDRVPLGFDLEWEGTHPVRRDDGRSSYRQACEVHGDVLVGDERIGLDGWGWRDHCWGHQDWWAGPWWWAAGRLADATVLEAQSGPAGQSGPCGSLARPGAATETLSSVAVDATMDERGLPVSAVAALDGLRLGLSPLAHAPVLVPAPDGRASHLSRSLCRFETADGRSGHGWASWLEPPGG